MMAEKSQTNTYSNAPSQINYLTKLGIGFHVVRLLCVCPMLQVDMDFKVVEAMALVAAEGAIEASGIDVSSLALSVGHVKNVVHRIVEPAKASGLITN